MAATILKTMFLLAATSLQLVGVWKGFTVDLAVETVMAMLLALYWQMEEEVDNDE